MPVGKSGLTSDRRIRILESLQTRKGKFLIQPWTLR
jgi:hypothetical protein